MSRKRATLVAFVATLLALDVGVAHGQAPPSGAAQSEVDRAVSLAHEGRVLYENGRFAQALERFRTADRIAHSPVLSLYVARCERNLNHLVAARDAFRIVANEGLGPDAPAPFVAAKSDATRELATLEPRIPRVKVDVPAATAATRIDLDGVAVDTTQPVWVDPGDHTLTRHDGPSVTPVSFRAVEGAATLTIELPAPGTATSTPPVGPDDEGGIDPGYVPGLAVLGVGVAALAVGTVTGVVALGKTNAIEDQCVDGHCPRSQEAAGDSANTFATVSTISFIVAGAATAAGVVLLVTLGGDDDAESAKSRPLEIAPTLGGARGTLTF